VIGAAVYNTPLLGGWTPGEGAEAASVTHRGQCGGLSAADSVQGGVGAVPVGEGADLLRPGWIVAIKDSVHAKTTHIVGAGGAGRGDDLGTRALRELSDQTARYAAPTMDQHSLAGPHPQRITDCLV
jgi:hypothetical protein